MKKIFSKIDYPLLIMVLIYIVLGLVMIYSSSSVSAVVRYGYKPYHFFVRQAIFVTAGIIAGIFILTFPTRNYKTMSWFLMFLIIFALGYLFISGKVTNNAISWYDFKYFKLQPSEFAKPILILFLASYYGMFQNKHPKNLYVYMIPLVFAAIVVILIAMQPDLGSAAIIFGIVFMTFISVPTIKNNIMKFAKIIAVIGVIGAVVLLYSGSSFLNSSQLKRFNFKNPCSRYTEETGYQVCNGFIAINNGGVFGVGLGNSTQKYLYLPESHTDFIFPIIVEELGLIVGILVVLGYLYILWRILKIAKSSENLRSSIIAYGTFWYLTLHILINLLGVLALVPLTGVPLPFLSYGGSFTLNAIFLMFLVERVAVENKINKANREIKAL